jgi:hypothetical protein
LYNGGVEVGCVVREASPERESRSKGEVRMRHEKGKPESMATRMAMR